MLAVRTVVQVRQRLRVPFGPRRHRGSEWRERIAAYDPGRNARQEVLGEERSERLILPRLQVARRPVVEQAKTSDVVHSFTDRDWLTKVVPAPDPHAEFQL